MIYGVFFLIAEAVLPRWYLRNLLKSSTVGKPRLLPISSILRSSFRSIELAWEALRLSIYSFAVMAQDFFTIRLR